MSIDTNDLGADCPHDTGTALQPRGGDSGPPNEVIQTPLKPPARYNFDALLAHLDQRFEPLLEKARVKMPAKPSVSEADAVDGKPSAPNGRFEVAHTAPNLFPFDRGMAPALAAAPPPGRFKLKGTVLALRGLGAPVHIGFDAEWQYHRKGRNKLLMVQFYLVGPTGEHLTKVFEVEDGEFIANRPSLVECLTELLEEAEERCIFGEWPSEAILSGFFTRADLPVFRDAKHFIRQMQGVNGTLVTVGKAAKATLPLGDAQYTRLKYRYSGVVGDDFDPRILSIRLVDASRLAPPGSSLEKLGNWLELPKNGLPKGYVKRDMARFQRERPEEFKAYGLRDAEIAVYYTLWVLWFCDRHLGLKGLPATGSGIGVRLAQLCMRRDGVHPDVALNFTKARHLRWNEQTNRPVSIDKRVPTQIRRWFEAFLADAYIGGRNECYWIGPTPVVDGSTRLYDHDLAACYLHCLAGLMVLDYDRIELVQDKERFKGHVAGYAQVRFDFPDDTPLPCLPVTTEKHGLWYPLSGVSIATAPEIELAMEMGAQIEVLFGVIIPWMEREQVFERSKKKLRARKAEKKDPDLEFDGEAFVPVEAMQFPPPSHGDVGYRPFESFALYARNHRLKYKPKSLPDLFIKYVGNSGYGKTGQGYKNKRAYGPQEEGSVAIGQSAISEAAYAALVSGLARAVLSEILWKLPPGTLVVSATTDGLLVDGEHLDLSGTMCQRFNDLVNRIAPGTSMTELKHVIAQAVTGKTRLQLTGKAVEGKEPVVAKGGIKVTLDDVEGNEAAEKHRLSPEGQNEFVLNLYVNRYPGQIIKRPSMMSMRDQLPNGWDLQTVDQEVRLSMEYDFKREPIDPRMIRIESLGIDHLACTTRPWRTVEEGLRVRAVFDQWHKGGKTPPHCLKTLDDYQDWTSFRQHHVGNRARKARHEKLLESRPPDDQMNSGPATRGVTGIKYITADTGYLGIAKRIFLTAYVQREWGLADQTVSQSKLAAWLSEQGYPTKVHDVKNAGRSMLYEHVVPAGDPEVTVFLALVKQRCPNLQVEKFLAT